jgi:hypothetical protein
MIPFAGYLQRHLRWAAPRTASLGAGAFAAGVMALILAGLVVSSPRLHGPARLPRLHEMLGRTAGLGIGLGMVLFCWGALKAHGLAPAGKRWYPRKLLVPWTLLTLPPLLGMALSEGLLLRARTPWPWSHAIYSGVRNSLAWHLGFWEWIGSAAVFLFLVSSALFVPEQGNPMPMENRRARHPIPWAGARLKLLYARPRPPEPTTAPQARRFLEA